MFSIRRNRGKIKENLIKINMKKNKVERAVIKRAVKKEIRDGPIHI